MNSKADFLVNAFASLGAGIVLVGLVLLSSLIASESIEFALCAAVAGALVIAVGLFFILRRLRIRYGVLLALLSWSLIIGVAISGESVDCSTEEDPDCEEVLADEVQAEK